MDLQTFNLDDLDLRDVHVQDATSDSANQLSQTTSAAGAFGKGPTMLAGSGSSVWPPFFNLDDLDLRDVRVDDATTDSVKLLSQTTAAAGAFAKGATITGGSGSGSGSSVWPLSPA